MISGLNIDIRKGKAVEQRGRLIGKNKSYEKTCLEKMDVRIDRLKPATFKIILDILNDFTLPRPGEQYRIRTQQQLNLIAIILRIVAIETVIDELTIATYTLNREAFGVLIDLLKSQKIQKLSLFLASSYSFRDKQYYEYLKYIAPKLHDSYDFHLAFAWIHLKVMLVWCGDNWYQSEGSMNFSTNNQVEQILFENRKDSYDYDYQFLHETLKAHNTKALEIVC